MGKTVFIYGLVDPRTGEVRYVGKTNNPEVRAQQHLRCRKYYAHTYKARWVASLKQEGVQPEFLLLEETDTINAVVREQHWIDHYRVLVGDMLTNATSGGQGPKNPIVGRVLSEETRRKIGLAGLGRPCSIETRRKMSLSRLGKKLGPMSKQTKNKLRQANLGKYFSFERWIRQLLSQRRKPFLKSGGFYFVNDLGTAKIIFGNSGNLGHTGKPAWNKGLKKSHINIEGVLLK